MIYCWHAFFGASRTSICCALAIVVVLGFWFRTCSWSEKTFENELNDYIAELETLRKEFGGIRDMPNVPFFLFGMGNRTKYLYKDGALTKLSNGEIVGQWDAERVSIIPSAYTVILTLKGGGKVVLTEDERGVWRKQLWSTKLIPGWSTKLIPGTSAPVSLPQFQEHRFGRVMRVLHHEILINILDSKPLPNFFVYKNPWRRDGAMMAMCLRLTNNVNTIRDWALSLNAPYDYNNAGEAELDNLGETFYILSLFTDKRFPLVETILSEAKKFEVISPAGKYLKGRSDFHETPVYQTKWYKFGLRSLGLPDEYVIPSLHDDYSALFWWEYKDSYLVGTADAKNRDKYPYLGWASDHFHKIKQGPISNRIYPLTWEENASQADYAGMRIVDKAYSDRKISSPHTWHAAEVFLYLYELRK